ncbi:MAG TPA: hypothetical protein VGG34_06570 [Opitutaceae bacterium]|jgi:hypothetical protein
MNAVFELTLALKLCRLARQLALGEGNPVLVGSIDALISRLRARAR